MAEWRRRDPLEGIAPRNGEGALRLVVRNRVAVVVVMARPGCTREMGGALTETGATVLATAPGEWTLLAETGADGAFARRLSELVGALGHVSEQSHGRQVLRISGGATRELLARGCRLDLHPRAAPPGFAARTSIGGFGCLLSIVDDTPTVDLVVAAGYARAFWRWLETHAAPFGPTIELWTAEA